MRARLVAGNWKMHGSRQANASLLDALLAGLGRREAQPAGCACAVCVPFPYLEQVAARLAGSAIAWGAQNLSEHAAGAFTGEVSAAMLAEFGCRYVIVGHSERRQLFGETDVQVAQKFTAAQAGGLTPILCVGETLEEREAGRTEAVVAPQLDAVLATAGAAAFARAVIAYEPVWAIGTGRTASAGAGAGGARVAARAACRAGPRGCAGGQHPVRRQREGGECRGDLLDAGRGRRPDRRGIAGGGRISGDHRRGTGEAREHMRMSWISG